MASLNKVMLIGNLGKDPEVRFTPSGKAVCNFSIATSESWTGSDGKKQEKTEWHNITAWGKTAELAGEYLSKGSSVYVEGRIETQTYEKDGEKKYKTNIVVDKLTFLSTKGSKNEKAPAPEQEGLPDAPF